MPTRRQLLATTLAATSAVVLPNLTTADEIPQRPRPNRIATSTYSFWRFLDDSKVSIEDCIRQSAAMGFDAVEILHRQMTGAAPGDNANLDNAYLQSLKKIAFTEGIDLCGLSIHQRFVSPDGAVRQNNIEPTRQ